MSLKNKILNWLSSQSYQDDFVIIYDDKSLNELPIKLKDKLILTIAIVGLNEENSTKAIAVLLSSVLV